MATYFARKAGNINATDVWATTPTGTAGNFFPSFTNVDILMSNNFTITVNVSTTVAEVGNNTNDGATAGGVFELSNGVTLTANIYKSGVNGPCVNMAGGISSATIIGNISGGSATNSVGARNNSTGTLTIIGNITGGSSAGAGASGASNNQIGTLNITGSVTGGSVNTNHGVSSSSGSGSIININGNVTGGSGSGCSGLSYAGAGVVNITGNITGGSGGNAMGINHSGTGTINITGNSIGGSSSSGFGSYLSANGTFNIFGTCIGSSVAFGAYNFNTGIMTITRAKGNNFGNGSTGLGSVVGVQSVQNGTIKVYEIEYGDLGQSPTGGPIQIVDAPSNVCLGYRTGGLSKKTLVDATATAGAFPANSNVRSGISFNNGSNVGTMAVPSASSVAYGVGVDNTTGSAVLTPANVWDYLTSNISTPNSIGERLKNCSTIASVGQQLADSLSG